MDELEERDDGELTGAQIERQDIVDNAIYNLVNELVPEAYRSMLPVEDSDSEGARAINWNIEWIAEIREQIEGVILVALNLPEGERDAFELIFYPYLVEEVEQEANV